MVFNNDTNHHFIELSIKYVLNLGDAVATALGLKVKTIKMLLLILAVILAGSAISVVGGISFLEINCTSYCETN